MTTVDVQGIIGASVSLHEVAISEPFVVITIDQDLDGTCVRLYFDHVHHAAEWLTEAAMKLAQLP